MTKLPKKWLLGRCKACRRLVMIEEGGTIRECPFVGCGAIGRIEFQWGDLIVGFAPDK